MATRKLKLSVIIDVEDDEPKGGTCWYVEEDDGGWFTIAAGKEDSISLAQNRAMMVLYKEVLYANQEEKG